MSTGFDTDRPAWRLLPWWARALIALVAVAVGVGVALMLATGEEVGDGVAEEVDASPDPAALASAQAAAASEAAEMEAALASEQAASEAAQATPTPTPTGPATTVLFNGGPATGPWQQIGTVAEITHPDAPASASYAYREGWSDPEEENQSDDLWDEIVQRVAAEAAELGEPVDRPAFGGADGSEPFNSFGGMQNVHREERRFSAWWNVVVDTPDGTATAYWLYLIDFEANVVAMDGPVLVFEDSSPTVIERSEELGRIVAEFEARNGIGG